MQNKKPFSAEIPNDRFKFQSSFLNRIETEISSIHESPARKFSQEILISMLECIIGQAHREKTYSTRGISMCGDQNIGTIYWKRSRLQMCSSLLFFSSCAFYWLSTEQTPDSRKSLATNIVIIIVTSTLYVAYYKGDARNATTAFSSPFPSIRRYRTKYKQPMTATTPSNA